LKRIALVLGIAFLAAMRASGAQHPVIFSPDISAQYGTVLPTHVDDDKAAVDDGAGKVAIPASVAAMFAAVPASAQVADFELSSAPAVGLLLAVDTTVALPGLPAGSPAEPRDVVRFDPTTGNFSLFFDGSANGIPDGVAIDAIATDPSDRLLLSFDTTVSLPGVGTVDDEDLVRFASGMYTMEFDGSAKGVPAELDLDAAHRNHNGNTLLLSFDGSGIAGGVAFDDEDVLAFDTVANTYAMYFDGSQSDPTDWPAADLVGLPEPGAGASLLGGMAALAALRIWRMRCRDSR
jgi:hypothetical protein